MLMEKTSLICSFLFASHAMSCQAFVPAASVKDYRRERSQLSSRFSSTTTWRRPRSLFMITPSCMTASSQNQHQQQDSLLSSNSRNSESVSSFQSAHQLLFSAISQKQTPRLPYLFKSLITHSNSITSVEQSNDRYSDNPLILSFLSAVRLCMHVNDSVSLSSIIHHTLSIPPPSSPSPSSSPSTTCQFLNSLRLSHFVGPFNYLATNCQFESIHTFLSLLFTLSIKYPKLSPDIRLLVRLANTATNTREYKHSLKIFSSMSQHNMKLNTYAYSVLLKCHGRARNAAAVNRVINNMRNDKDLEVDVILLNSALDALVRCENVRAAQHLLLNVSYDTIVDVMSYNTVIKGVVGYGTIREAFRLAARMQAAGIDVDAVTVNTLMYGCVVAGDFETAKSLIKSFYYGEESAKSKDGRIIGDGANKDKNVIRFKAPTPPKPPLPPPELRDKLSSNNFNVVSDDDNEKVKSSSTRSASNNLKRGKESSNDNREYDSDDTEPIILLDLSSSSSHLKQTNEYGKSDMTEKNERVFKKQVRIAMTTFLWGLAEAGRISEAINVLDEMHERRIEPNSITYAALISACFNQSLCEEAMSLFESTGIQFDRRFFINNDLVIVHSVIVGLCKQDGFHWVEEAGDIVEHMLSKRHNYRNHRKNQYKSIESREEVDSISEMQQTLKGNEGNWNIPNNNISSPRIEIEILNSVLNGYVRYERFDRAEQILNLMRRYGISPTASSYTILICGYTNVRQFDRAKKTFHDMLRFKQIEPDRVVMNTYISLCTKSGDLKSAMKVIQYMESYKGGELNPSAQSYSPILLSYARNFEHEQVWNVYNRMRTIGGVPVNDFILKLLCEYVVRTVANIRNVDDRVYSFGKVDDDASGDKQREKMIGFVYLAEKSSGLLRHGLEDAVSARVLRIGKKKLLPLFSAELRKRYFAGLDAVEFRSASETIFERHGWNNIDSGWRFL